MDAGWQVTQVLLREDMPRDFGIVSYFVKKLGALPDGVNFKTHGKHPRRNDLPLTIFEAYNLFCA
jgi:hypothetical protein